MSPRDELLDTLDAWGWVEADEMPSGWWTSIEAMDAREESEHGTA